MHAFCSYLFLLLLSAHRSDIHACGRFGYSVGQMGCLGTTVSPLGLATALARGGPPMLSFRNASFDGAQQPLATTRAALRLSFVESAKSASSFFRDEWLAVPRPRITHNTFSACSWIRAPFTVRESLPEESDSVQVSLASWETAFRAIEEQLTVAVFGMLPNVTWARILANVFARFCLPSCL